MFLDHLRRTVASTDGTLSEFPTRSTKLSQYCHGCGQYVNYVDKSFTRSNRGTVSSRQQAATTRPLTSSIQPCGPKARVKGILVCCIVRPSLSLFECNG